ncbi:YciI family protein [Derxia gummosa]|uniref:YciI family protein n=1 Tax=Derxia gummosa DSM 723 TaxID=1121388 RepID=A0A8B6X506_9BURK|nr:YciI family protein [Derxia gummosa]
MRFALLINEPPTQRAGRGEAEGREAYARMLDFAARLRAEGRLVAAESLAHVDTATRVRVRDGRPALLDGPFAEVKEMLGGFFLVEAASRAEALEIAARCPAAAWCEVEVRELGPCFMSAGR